MRLILAARARNQAKWVPVSRPDCAHIVTFKARPDAKPVTTLAERAFAGLRSYGKGANRTPPTRCPAFSRVAATGPPRRPSDFGLGFQPRAGRTSHRRRGLKT